MTRRKIEKVFTSEFGVHETPSTVRKHGEQAAIWWQWSKFFCVIKNGYRFNDIISISIARRCQEEIKRRIMRKTNKFSSYIVTKLQGKMLNIPSINIHYDFHVMRSIHLPPPNTTHRRHGEIDEPYLRHRNDIRVSFRLMRNKLANVSISIGNWSIPSCACVGTFSFLARNCSTFYAVRVVCFFVIVATHPMNHVSGRSFAHFDAYYKWDDA